jgi:hypothetical protein
VSGFEVADAAVLDEGDAAAAELELEQIGVVAGAHQDGLVAQACPLLVVGEHAVGDLVRLLGLVPAEYELRPAALAAFASQRFRVRALGLRGDEVGDVEDRLCGAVVALERHHLGIGEGRAEVEDVLGAGGAEAVDRLEVVADDGETAFAPAECFDDVDLQAVDVLVLVDEDVVEHRGELRSGLFVDGEGAPVQQEIVEVEQIAGALPLAVGPEDPADFYDPDYGDVAGLATNLAWSPDGNELAFVRYGAENGTGYFAWVFDSVLLIDKNTRKTRPSPIYSWEFSWSPMVAISSRAASMPKLPR